MKTLEQAIAKRLEEKRQERDEAERKRQQWQTEVQRRERIVAALFGEWLEAEYHMEVTDLDIVAKYCDSPKTYRVYIEFDRGEVECKRPVSLLRTGGTAYNGNGLDVGLDLSEVMIDVVPTNNAAYWHATYRTRDTAYVDYINFIDAVIYAKYGSSQPEFEAN
jgi:hypothetical protein